MQGVIYESWLGGSLALVGAGGEASVHRSAQLFLVGWLLSAFDELLLPLAVDFFRS